MELIMTRNQLPSFRSPLSLLDSFFSDALPEAFPESQMPLTDIVETKDSFVVTMDLPGIAEQDVQVEFHERTLKVRAERKDPPLPEGAQWRRRQRQAAKFRSAIVLPQIVDGDAIEAQLVHGVLRVTIKKVAKAMPVQVQIRGA
jgi:HSP20 family protein